MNRTLRMFADSPTTYCGLTQCKHVDCCIDVHMLAWTDADSLGAAVYTRSHSMPGSKYT